jgi:hypothetical protein
MNMSDLESFLSLVGIIAITVIVVDYLMNKEQNILCCRYCGKDLVQGDVHHCFAMCLSGIKKQKVPSKSTSIFATIDDIEHDKNWRRSSGVLGKK